jgi:hypothetical protein
VPLSQTGAELLFEVFSQRYERGSTLVTSNLPFDEWTGVFGSERLTGALLDRLTHHVHILEMNGDSYTLNQGKRRSRRASSETPTDHRHELDARRDRTRSLLFLPPSVTDYCSGKPMHFCSDVDRLVCLPHRVTDKFGVGSISIEPTTRKSLLHAAIW